MKRTISVIINFLFYLTSLLASAQKAPELIIPKGHTGFVSGVFTPNGKQLFAYGEDLNPTIWEVTSARVLGYLKYTKNIQNAFFLNDRKTLVTISMDAEVVFWDWNSKRIIYTLQNKRQGESRVFVNEKKTRIAIVSPDGNIANWDIISRKMLSFIPVPKKVKPLVSTMALSTDGTMLATAFYPAATVQVWRVNDGKLIKSVPLASELPDALSFFADGTLCIAANFETSGSGVKLFSHSRFESFKTLELFGDNNIMNYNNSLLVSGTEHFLRNSTKSLTVTDYKTGDLKFSLDHSKIIIRFSLLQNGQLVSITEEGSVYFWDITTGELLHSIETGSVGTYKNIVVSPDNKITALLTTDIFGAFSLNIVDTRMHNLIANFEKSSNFITDIFASPDGNTILFNEERSIKVWELGCNGLKQVGNTESLLGYSKSSIENEYYIDKGLGFLRTGIPQIGVVFANWKAGWLMTAPHQLYDTIKLWNLKDLTLQKSFSCDKEILTFRPDQQGERLLISFADSTFTITPITAGDKKFDYYSINKPISGAKFLPDGTGVVLVSEDSVFLYDILKKKVLRTNYVNKEVDEYYILSNSCRWLLRDNGQVIDLQENKLLFTVPDMGGGNWKKFSNNDSLIAYQSTRGTINIFDVTRRKISRVFNEKKGEVLQLEFSRNSNWLLTSLDDRTTRVWDITSGKEIAAFVLFGESDFLIQLPTGYYMGTQNAAKLLHYVQREQIVSFEQLDTRYNRPDKVLEALGTTDTALLESYRKAWYKRIKKLGIDTTAFLDRYSVPEATFLNREAIEYDLKNETLTLQIRGIDSTYALDRFNVWVNEVPVFGLKGQRIRRRNSNRFDTTVTITLSQGENRITTSITNVNQTESYRLPLTVKYSPSVAQKETAHFIGIGIDKFADPVYNLQYSSKDIRDLSFQLKEKYGEDILVDTSFDENVTVSNVKSLREKLQQTTVNDKVIIAYSGHGLLGKEYDYYLSTYSVNFEKPEQNGLHYDELENLLDSIPARKKLMLIDACHSGEVDKDELFVMNKTADSMGLSKGVKIGGNQQQQQVGLKNSFELMQSLFVNVGKSTGATIISAAAGNQFALERGDLKNGVFTFAILEAMKSNPNIKISELKKIVGERVEQLTNGMQKPTSRNETIAVDWEVW